MEPMTALVLAFQLLALFSIAGALLLYLIWKLRDDSEPARNSSNTTEEPVRSIPAVLVTSADTALGLQLCTYLASNGCRVFAGMKDAKDSLPSKLLANWLSMREFDDIPTMPIHPIQLDVTRGDMIHEAIIAMGAHMNAGENGISAVINTSGSIYRGRIESQEVQQWAQMLNTNILGALRVAKSFVGLLRPTQGRLIYLGAGATNENDDGLTAFNASRVAVEKCVEELRKELDPYGVKVITMDTTGLSAESLYKAPVRQNDEEGAPKQYSADVLSAAALQVIERALWDELPHERYQLSVPQSRFNFQLPCRSSLRLIKAAQRGVGTTGVSRVQSV